MPFRTCRERPLFCVYWGCYSQLIKFNSFKHTVRCVWVTVQSPPPVETWKARHPDKFPNMLSDLASCPHADHRQLLVYFRSLQFDFPGFHAGFHAPPASRQFCDHSHLAAHPLKGHIPVSLVVFTPFWRYDHKDHKIRNRTRSHSAYLPHTPRAVL